MKPFVHILLFLFIVFLSVTARAASWYSSTINGVWSSSSVWAPGGVPVNGDGVTVSSGDTVTYNGDFAWTSGQVTVAGVLIVNGNMTINNGIGFYFSGTGTVEVTRDVYIQSSSIYLSTGAEFNVGGALTLANGDLGANGYAYLAVGDSLYVSGQLNVNGVYSVAGNLTVGGQTIVQSSSMLTVGENMTCGGQLSNSGTVVVDGDLTMSDTGSPALYNQSGGLIVVNGDLTKSGDIGVSSNSDIIVVGNFTSLNGNNWNSGDFYVFGDATGTNIPSNLEDEADWEDDSNPGNTYVNYETTPAWWEDHTANAGETNGPDPVCAGENPVFTLNAVSSNTGSMASNTIEWAVYGGAIVSYNGTSIETESGTLNSHTISFQSVYGIDGVTAYTIEIQWDNPLFSGMYVAVRQSSASGCSDGSWSIYYISGTAASLTINSNPSNENVCDGELASFSVDASNANGYLWQVSSNSGTSWSDLSDSSPYSGSSTNTLAINTVNTSMNGCQYRCLVLSTTCKDDTTTVASLTVYSTPTADLISSDADNSICSGDEVTFTGSGGTTYEFFVGGSSVQGPGTSTTYTTSTLNNGDVVYVEVTDANGCSSASSGIMITIAVCNPAPVAVNDIYATAYNTPVSGLTILLNDTDDSGLIDPTTVVLAPGTGNVTVGNTYTDGSGNTWVVNTSGELTFTPASGFTGTATVTYTVKDYGSPIGTSNAATVSVTILNINCPAGGNLGCNPGTPTEGTTTYYEAAPWVRTSTESQVIEIITGCAHTYTFRHTAEWKINGTTGSFTQTCDEVYTFTVDAENPVVNCTSQTVNANTAGCNYTVSGTGFDAVVSDDCTITSLVHNYNLGGSSLNGEVFPVGTTTVIWTVTDVCGKASTCQQTITVQRINAVVSDVSDDITDDCPDFLAPFDANNSSYNPGASQVKFRVARMNSSTSWSFDFEITGTNMSIHSLNIQGDMVSPEPSQSSGNNYSGTINAGDETYVDFIIQVVNVPGSQISIDFLISNVSGLYCGETNTADNAGTHQLNVMPIVGSFN